MSQFNVGDNIHGTKGVAEKDAENEAKVQDEKQGDISVAGNDKQSKAGKSEAKTAHPNIKDGGAHKYGELGDLASLLLSVNGRTEGDLLRDEDGKFKLDENGHKIFDTDALARRLKLMKDSGLVPELEGVEKVTRNPLFLFLDFLLVLVGLKRPEEARASHDRAMDDANEVNKKRMEEHSKHRGFYFNINKEQVADLAERNGYFRWTMESWLKNPDGGPVTIIIDPSHATMAGEENGVYATL